MAGSGKSTLMGQIYLGGKILSSSSAASHAAKLSTKRLSDTDLKRRIARRIPLLRKAVLHGDTENGERTAFARFAEEHDAFLAAVHESVFLPGRSHYRQAEGYYHFIRAVRRIAFLERWLENTAVLFDESLSQKAYAVTPCDRVNEMHARRYFEQMPLPTALIHLDADATQVVRQVRERERATGKLIPGHRGLNDEELRRITDAGLHLARIGAECLHTRGCPVLSLAASEPLERNAQSVTEFVQGFVQ